MRTCKECKQTKSDEEMVIGRNWCYECKKIYMKAYNQLPERKADRKQRKTAERLEKRNWLDNLKDKPCADCLKSFPPRVMDFHHIGNKVEGVGELLWSKGKAAVLKEIENCVLLCANCHRLRH